MFWAVPKGDPMSEAKMARREPFRSQVFCMERGGTARTQSSGSLRDPETACNALVGLHSTTTESDPS